MVLAACCVLVTAVERHDATGFGEPALAMTVLFANHALQRRAVVYPQETWRHLWGLVNRHTCRCCQGWRRGDGSVHLRTIPFLRVCLWLAAVFAFLTALGYYLSWTAPVQCEYKQW